MQFSTAAAALALVAGVSAGTNGTVYTTKVVSSYVTCTSRQQSPAMIE